MIALYRPAPGLGPATALHNALVSCFTKLGVGHEERACKDYAPSAVAVVHGWKKRKLYGSLHDRAPIIDGQIRSGGQVLCCERGMWDRQNTHVLAWDGMHGSANWGHVAGMPGDRWAATGLELKPWRTDGDHILVCGQVPWDANITNDHLVWLRRVMHAIRERTKRLILFRPHPLAISRGGDYGSVVRDMPADTAVSGHTRPVEDDLAGAWACVSFNSNTSFDAVLMGVPAFTFHENAMAFPVTGHDLDTIEDPPMPDRTPWVYDMAYRQWGTAEVASGEAWEWVGMGMRQ